MATGWRSRTVFGEKGTAEMGVTEAVMYKKKGGSSLAAMGRRTPPRV